MILGLSSPLQHASAVEWGAKHRELGCRAINFPVNCLEPEEKIAAYEKACRENDLIIAEVGVWRNTLAADRDERNQAIKYAIGQLELADRLGANCCVNIIGTPHGPVWDGGYAGNYSKETWKEAVSMIQTIIDAVKPKNTKYTIETMPWMVPSSPQEYKNLMEDVARDEFGVHLDFINMINSPRRYFFADEFMEECFETLSGKIVSCHLKDVKLLGEYTFQLRESACGEGSINLEKYAALANKERPDMPMIIEHLSTDEEYLESLHYVKKRLKDYIR